MNKLESYLYAFKDIKDGLIRNTQKL